MCLFKLSIPVDYSQYNSFSWFHLQWHVENSVKMAEEAALTGASASSKFQLRNSS